MNAYDFDRLRAELADYLGYGRDVTGDGLAEVGRYVNDGVGRFLLGIDPRTQRAYAWSFLAPAAELKLWAAVPAGAATVDGVYDDAASTRFTASAAVFCDSMVGHEVQVDGVGAFTITAVEAADEATVAGNATCTDADIAIAADGAYTLPEDFAALLEGLTYGDGEARLLPASVAEVRRRLGASPTGTPRQFALMPLVSDALGQLRWQVLVAPAPGYDRTVHYRYRRNPADLSAASDRPPCGAEHGPAVLACCLAVAEQRRNDGQSYWQQRAEDLLAASIDIDARNKPRRLGGSPAAADRRGTVTYGD
mgnify:FL=1